MGRPGRSTEKAVRTLAEVMRLPRDDLLPAGLPPSLLDDLGRTIPCDGLSFYDLDSSVQTTTFMQEHPAPPSDGRADPRAFWDHYWDSWCSYSERSGDLDSVLIGSDFVSQREWHASPMYTEYGRYEGLEHELVLCLPADTGPRTSPSRTVRLMFTRSSGPDFSEVDRALLVLLRPHLLRAFRDAERRRDPVPRLTPRQWELLRLVAAGHTNGQIARRLGVSEGTVRTHLEHIYRRLNVSSRTAAITRAFADTVA